MSAVRSLRLGAATVVAAGALALAGCGGSDDGPPPGPSTRDLVGSPIRSYSSKEIVDQNLQETMDRKHDNDMKTSTQW